jgi:hypothetical protein
LVVCTILFHKLCEYSVAKEYIQYTVRPIESQKVRMYMQFALIGGKTCAHFLRKHVKVLCGQRVGCCRFYHSQIRTMSIVPLLSNCIWCCPFATTLRTNFETKILSVWNPITKTAYVYLYIYCCGKLLVCICNLAWYFKNSDMLFVWLWNFRYMYTMLCYTEEQRQSGILLSGKERAF